MFGDGETAFRNSSKSSEEKGPYEYVSHARIRRNYNLSTEIFAYVNILFDIKRG